MFFRMLAKVVLCTSFVGVCSSQEREVLLKRRWGVDTVLVIPREKVRKGLTFSIKPPTFLMDTRRGVDGSGVDADADGGGGGGEGCGCEYRAAM